MNHGKETPPRTWGRRRIAFPVAGDGGNTPTHVGKTGTGQDAAAGSRKHPHARGEDLSMPDSREWYPETPPRTWGRRGGGHGGVSSVRNTPTHVGKTTNKRFTIFSSQKHPHARGEDQGTPIRREGQEETPPRTWGRQPNREPWFWGRQKHPHARGEDSECVNHTINGGETPPRTWGRPIFSSHFLSFLRNTPTHVGKTLGIY